MDKSDPRTLRITRLADLIAFRFAGNRAALGRALGHHDGSSVRKMLAGRSPITEKTVWRIESLTSLEGWFSQEASGAVMAAVSGAGKGAGKDAGKGARSKPGEPLPSIVIPVLGTTSTGPTRALDWPEPWPLVDGDLYVEALAGPRDAQRHAYALRVEGPGLQPRGLDGEWLVVSPGASPCAGDDVVLKTWQGAVTVCQLVALYDEHVVLIGLAPPLSRTTRLRSELEFMHPVTMLLPRRRGRRHVDRPGYRGPERRVAQVPISVERRRV